MERGFSQSFLAFSSPFDLRSYRTTLVLCLVLLVFGTTGCLRQWMRSMAPEDALLLSYGRFGDLERLMESRVPQLSMATTANLWYRCQAYAELKKYNKLFPCLDQMERNIARGDAWFIFDYRVGRTNISYVPPLWRAQAYLELKDYEKAVTEAARAADTAEAAHAAWRAVHLLNFFPNSNLEWQIRLTKIRALGVQAISHFHLGHRDKAREYALAIEAFEIPIMGVAGVMLARDTELARVSMALGEFERAYKASEDNAFFEGFAMPVMDFLIGGEEGESALSTMVLPQKFFRYKSAYETKRVEEAKKGYDELLQHPGLKTFGELYWIVLLDRGRIAEGEGARPKAIDYYKQAIEIIEQQRSTVNTEASKIGFVGDKQQAYQTLVSALLAEKQEAEAFEYVERSKARALVDLLASKQDFAVASGQEQQVAQLLTNLQTAEAEAIVQDPSLPKEQTTLRSARGIQITGDLKRENPELASLVAVTTTRTAEIQALLKPDETLVEYYAEGDALVVFVLTKTHIGAVSLKSANLAADVSAFRQALEDPRSNAYQAWSRKLHDRLLAPVAQHLTTKSVLIVPHGALHYLPWAALCTEKDCLIDRAGLRLLPSASVMPFLKSRKADREANVLVFGNPDLGDPQYDLKFAQKEAEAIAKAFTQPKLLVRKEASKQALQIWGSQFTYLHFATHGKFDPDAPMKSGLLLAGEKPGADVLTLGDLYSLRLNADLVTLSACETGLGKLHNGDDVVGLTRGFLYAGSSSIVASLWQVDDLATSLLMTQFYANLKKMDKRDALRQAQLATKKQYPHPFYWAAFQLTGMP